MEGGRGECRRIFFTHTPIYAKATHPQVPQQETTHHIRFNILQRSPKRLSTEMLPRSPSPEFSPLAIGTDLTPLPTYKAPSTISINFSNLLEPPLKLHEDLKSGCGGQLWPAGMVLAHHMLRYHRNSLKDARM